jgi:hypothetical protein
LVKLRGYQASEHYILDKRKPHYLKTFFLAFWIQLLARSPEFPINDKSRSDWIPKIESPGL